MSATALARFLMSGLARRAGSPSPQRDSKLLNAIPQQHLDDPQVREHFSQLARLKVQLSLATTTLATKMRLTNQSRYPTRTAARREQATRIKPWDLRPDGSQLDQSSDDDSWN